MSYSGNAFPYHKGVLAPIEIINSTLIFMITITWSLENDTLHRCKSLPCATALINVQDLESVFDENTSEDVRLANPLAISENKECSSLEA